MALVIPPFNTSAVITGNTLISQADEQLNILMNDVDTYVVSTFNEVAQTLQDGMPSLGLDTSLNNIPTVGQMTWNQDESTINVGLPFNIIGQMFQEYFVPVRNTSGSTILNGRPVMAIGTTGNSGRVLVNYHDGLISSGRRIIGITTSDITNNSDSLITVSGKVRGIDTTGVPYGETWVDGDIIYVKPNSNGLLTNIEPSDTQLKIPIAFVVHAHTNGTLLVRTTPIDENLYKPWTQSKLDLKADTTNVYNKTQIDSLLNIINNRLSALENV